MPDASLPWSKRRGPYGASSINIPFAPRDTRDARDIANRMSLEPERRRQRTWREAITASAARLNRAQIAKLGKGKGEAWQDEAWACYGQVGELHYAAQAHANGVGRLFFELLRTDEDGGDVKLNDVPPADWTAADQVAINAMTDLAGDSPTGLGELQRMAAINLFIAGDCALVGMVPQNATDSDATGLIAPPPVQVIQPAAVDEDYTGPLTSLTWRIYSTGELKQEGSTVTISGQDYDSSEVVVIRLWNPHPRNCMAADSPVRASLPVLRELIGLTMHISATIDSRLAGAGVLYMPASAMASTVSDNPEEDDNVNPVVEDLISSMVTPIKDRDSASAVVPFIITIPDDAPWRPEFQTFSTPFDGMTKELRDEAIRRLALGLDMPPEVLLGVGDSSHWNAWQVQEDNVRTHVMPVGFRLCDALTREYLRVVMVEAGIPEAEAANYSLTPDASALIDRPNRADEALALYRIGALTQGALLDASGFRAEDSPSYGADAAIQFAIQMVMEQPSLAISIGLDKLVDQLRAAFSGVPGQPIPAIDEDPDAQGMLDPNAPELPHEKDEVVPRESIRVPGAPGGGTAITVPGS